MKIVCTPSFLSVEEKNGISFADLSIHGCEFDVNCSKTELSHRTLFLACRYFVKFLVSLWTGDEHSEVVIFTFFIFLHVPWALESPGGLLHLHLSLRLEFITSLLCLPRTHLKRSVSRTCAINLRLRLVVCRYLKPSCPSQTDSGHFTGHPSQRSLFYSLDLRRGRWVLKEPGFDGKGYQCNILDGDCDSLEFSFGSRARSPDIWKGEHATWSLTAIVSLVKGHNIELGPIPTSDVFSLSRIMIISDLGSEDTCLGLLKFPLGSVQFPNRYQRNSLPCIPAFFMVEGTFFAHGRLYLFKSRLGQKQPLKSCLWRRNLV